MKNSVWAIYRHMIKRMIRPNYRSNYTEPQSWRYLVHILEGSRGIQEGNRPSCVFIDELMMMVCGIERNKKWFIAQKIVFW